MPHPLDSARLKLDRAREHIDTIRAETIPYMAQDPPPYGMRGDKDPETRDKLIVLEARVPSEPGGFFKLAEPLVVTMAKRQLQNDLDNLRDLMEARAL
jgi:hypothetical protein